MQMFSRARRTPAPAARVISSDPLVHRRVVAPDPARLIWMEELREFLRGPDVELGDPTYLESRYLDYCTYWHAQPPERRWNPRTVLNALGVALGDCVRAAVPGLLWRVIDQPGPTTLVLATIDGVVVSSPLEEVANRWMMRDLNWLRAYPDDVLRSVARSVEPPTRARRRLLGSAAGPSPR